jgi:hypothetical protein
VIKNMDAHLLAKNNFGMPKVLTDGDANYMHIVYLLLLDPGTFQTHPEMGVGIRQYRFVSDDDIIDTIKSSILNQMNRFLPDIDVNTVSLSIIDGATLGIAIDTSNGVYAIGFNSTTGELEVGATYVLEQLKTD